MFSLPDFGYSYPPGVTEDMIDRQFELLDDEEDELCWQCGVRPGAHTLDAEGLDAVLCEACWA